MSDNKKNNFPQTQRDVKISFDTIADRSVEVNLKSKHQAATGIDLVTKGTINKTKAEKLLLDAKDFAVQGEALRVRGNEILTDSKNLEDIGAQAREEYKTLLLESEEAYKRYVEFKRLADEKLEASEKAFDEVEAKYAEGTEFVARGQVLVDKANSLLQEANILNENANKWISEGNELLDDAKINSNTPLKSIPKITSEHFTIDSTIGSILTNNNSEENK